VPDEVVGLPYVGLDGGGLVREPGESEWAYRWVMVGDVEGRRCILPKSRRLILLDDGRNGSVFGDYWSANTHWSLLTTYGENEEMGGRRGFSRSGLGLID
jgi:hypothetical protein